MSQIESKSSLFNKAASYIDTCLNNPAVHTAGLALNSLALGACFANPVLAPVFGALAAFSGVGLLMSIVREPEPARVPVKIDGPKVP